MKLIKTFFSLMIILALALSLLYVSYDKTAVAIYGLAIVQIYIAEIYFNGE